MDARKITGLSLRVATVAALMAAAAFAGWRGAGLINDQVVTIHGWPLTGGIALCVASVVAAGLAAQVIHAKIDDRWLLFVLVGCFVLLAALTVLASAWTYHDHVVAGAVAAGLVIVVAAMALIAMIADGWPQIDREVLVYAAAPLVLIEGAAGSMAFISGLRGRPTAEWIFAGVGIGTLVLLLGAFLLGRGRRRLLRFLLYRRRRRDARSGPRHLYSPVRAVGVSLPLQLAGLVAPVASVLIVLVPERVDPFFGQPGRLFNVLAVAAGVAVAAAAIQQALLAWLALGSVEVDTSGLGAAGPKDHPRRPDELSPREREEREHLQRDLHLLRRRLDELSPGERGEREYLEERLHYLRRRLGELSLGEPDDAEHLRWELRHLRRRLDEFSPGEDEESEHLERELHYRERELRRLEAEQRERLAWMRNQQVVQISTILRRSSGISRPLMTRVVMGRVADIAQRTGLLVDAVWPRMELVLPPEVRRRFRRADRSVAALRTAVASAVATAVAWTVAFLVAPFSAYAVAAPLLIAAALFLRLRVHVGDLYRQRADAIDVYRFDLATSLHVPIPRNPQEFADSAGVLMGTEPMRELTSAVAESSGDAGRLSAEATEELRESIVRDVARTVSVEVRSIQDTQERLASQLRNPVLRADQLADLATSIARQAAEPVATRLSDRVEELERSFYQRIGQAVQESIEASVVGPPLINFTGFMVIDLHGDSATRPPHGNMISAPVGGVLELSLFVLRDETARGAAPRLETAGQFFVAEPIHIEGGREAPTVEFEAVADSPTLHPQPNRRSVVVQAAAETMFVFPMPPRPGRHEIWFQLCQGGRLIQAVTVSVEAAGAEQASVEE